MRIYKEFTFEAAHLLPSAPQGHPNARIHGHSFRVRVWVRGEPDAQTGLIVHFGTLEKALQDLKDKIDHHYLNDIEGLENPTLERLSQWMWAQLSSEFTGLAEIEIARDTCNEGCVYRGGE